MPSSEKTSNLNLNIWSGTDKPKREDFNADNQNIEQAVSAHSQDTEIHVTRQEKNNWNQKNATTGYFSGNGAASREVTTGFKPSAVFIMSVGKPGMETGQDGTTLLRSSVAVASQAGFGVSVTETGFRVFDDSYQGVFNTRAQLNQSSVSYFYVAYR